MYGDLSYSKVSDRIKKALLFGSQTNVFFTNTRDLKKCCNT